MQNLVSSSIYLILCNDIVPLRGVPFLLLPDQFTLGFSDFLYEVRGP